MRARLRQRADLLVELVRRDLRLRYRRSILGVAWSQLAPLTLLAVLTFVFAHVVPLGIPNYAVYVYTGLLAWTWFSGALVGMTDSIVANPDLVRRPGFPVEVLPVGAVCAHLVFFVLALPVLAVPLALGPGLHPTVAAVPLVMAAQFLFLLGPGFVLAAANVTFRDVSHLVGVVLVPLFYATPVFYAPQQVPHRFRWAYELNPAHQLVAAYRAALVEGRWPDPAALAAVAAAGAVLALAGRAVFVRGAHRFAEDLG